MSRRLEIELTSQREDGSWTWRAAGARQPKGSLDGAVLPSGARVGQELTVEVEDVLDGIEVLSSVQKRERSQGVQTLELLGSGNDAPGVTTQLQPKGRGGDRGRGGNRGRGGDRGRDDRGRDAKARSRSSARDDRGEASRSDRPRRERPKPPDRPKPKRLRPAQRHRKAALAELAPELRPLGDVVVRGGIPGVRAALDEQNQRNATQGRAEIPAERLVALAEKLLPDLRVAEWHDRADAALEGMSEVDLRDLRSVVVAADTAAKTDETRALAEQIRNGLTERVDSEQRKWLAELAQTLDEGRTVRALRLSSRPPKAGSPLPQDLSERLVSAAVEGLSAEDSADRWATVLDALAYSPVRAQVLPTGVPSDVSKTLKATLKKVGGRVPQIAALFEDPKPAPKVPAPPKPEA